MLDWDEANNLPDAATWLLETRKCYRGCQKGLKQTDWGVSPQEPKFHKIPNWRRLDHRRPTQQYIQYSGGCGTKKGDRGYIRLIPRAATTPCVPLSPAIILRKSALYPWESLMLMILALSSTFYPFYPLNHHLTPERGLVFLRNLIWWEKNSTKSNTIIL